MARYTGPACRLCRREGVKLFLKGERCYTEKCPIEKGASLPGKNAKSFRARKLSTYGVRLREKQKLRKYYGLLEKQFKNYFKTNRTFYPISGSYESAVSGNQITTFRNKELVQKVVKLYNSTYDRLIDNGQILDERWDFLSKKYSYERRTGVFREMKPDQLTEFLDDLYHHYVQMEWYLKQLKTATTEIDKINAEK